MKDKILACVTVVVALVFIYSLVFIKPEFNVTFNENNDSDLVNVEVIKKGEKATMPRDPQKEGYTFKYWELDGKEYDFDEGVTSNITLNAVYEEVVKETNNKTSKKR